MAKEMIKPEGKPGYYTVVYNRPRRIGETTLASCNIKKGTKIKCKNDKGEWIEKELIDIYRSKMERGAHNIKEILGDTKEAKGESTKK